MNPDMPWRGWDGRRLELHAAGDCALCLDGAVFEPLVAGEFSRDFRFSPNGGAELEFALRNADGGDIAAPWRVRFGEPAIAGIDVWQGDAHALQALDDLPLPTLETLSNAPPPAIVVPIYNSPQCVQRCIAALLRHTPMARRKILIDDASTDPAIGEILRGLPRRPDILIRRNTHNLGYTATCNLGIALAGRADVVLLNADTQVGPRWLERLRLTAYADAAIGTVTAVSDNAGAFSVPELERHCPIPERWNLEQTQRALLQRCGGCRPQLPTGNGFCLYVKRELFDHVGVLDVDAFPAGYGEENDLCQRAERAGYRHVIAGDVLVQHARSASFGAERRAALGTAGMAVLRERYPDYERDVGATLWSFERRVLDWRVRRLYAGTDGHYAAQPPRPRMAAIGADPAVVDGAVEIVHAPPRDAFALRIWLAHHAIEAVQTVDAAAARVAASVGVPAFDATQVAPWVANVRPLA
ncbi:MAG: glycosyltransferase [Proteobacteria bacterium]|nr:glycosyltransferase [Pseudomonadota bacterium]